MSTPRKTALYSASQLHPVLHNVVMRAALKLNGLHSRGSNGGKKKSYLFRSQVDLQRRWETVQPQSGPFVVLAFSQSVRSPSCIPVLEIAQCEWTVSTAYWWLIFSSPDTPNCKRISMNFHIDSEWIRGLLWLDELHNMNVIESKQCVG